MKEEIEQVYSAIRELNNSIDQLSYNWSTNPAYRNRPERQKLMTELWQFFHATRQIEMSNTLDDIAKACEVEIK